MKRYIILAFLSLMSTVFVSAQGPSIVGKWTTLSNQDRNQKTYLIMNFDSQGEVTFEMRVVAYPAKELELNYFAKVKGHYERSVKAISQEFELNSMTSDLEIFVNDPRITEEQKNQFIKLLKQESQKEMANIEQGLRPYIAHGIFYQIISLSDELLVLGQPNDIHTFHKGGIEDYK